MRGTRALDQAAAGTIPNAFLGLGAIFLAFAVFDHVFYPPDVGLKLTLADGLCGAALVAAALVARLRTIRPEHAHPVMATVAFSVLANTSYGIAIGSEPLESVYLVLLVMGTGAIFLSWRWNLAVVLGVYASWGLMASSAPFDWGRQQYALGLFGACAVSMLMCGVRIEMYKRAEKLRERLDAVVTRAPIVLFSLDREGVFTFASGRGFDGLAVDPASLIGRSIFEFYPGIDDVLKDVRRALAGESFTSSVNAERKTFLVSYGPMRDESGRVSGVIGVATDVTERTRAEAELDASRKHLTRQERLASLGTLVAGVAHEINNPLAFVRGNTQITRDVVRSIAQDPKLSEAQRRDLAEAAALQEATLEGVDRLSHISESLRSVARSGSSGARSAEDANALVRMSVTVARPRLGKSLTVETDLRATRPVLCERGEIGQVVLNLLLNAADELAGRDDGRLVLRTSDTSEGMVLFEVEDNGRGIPVKDHVLIFAPFFTTKTHGTGLGLSICHRIVEDHGGILSFESAPGRTVFRLTLPAAPVAALTSPATLA